MTLGESVLLTEQDLVRLRELISDYSGLDASIQTDNALQQAVSQRLVAHQLNDIADYWSLLQRRPGNNGEINSLVRLLTNKETFFFREMHHFNVLREQLLPELLRATPQPLRIWSAGCATGEEPYSLAITLLEYQARHGKLAVQVIATDIDVVALEKARQGRYDERAVRQMPDDLCRRYFSFDGATYQILPAVAELVTFRVHNLAEDNNPPGLTNMSVIFCRNVTIYFDAEARDRLNARLASSLQEGGYLFVASAETIGHNRGRLELISIGNTFLFRKGPPLERQSPSSLFRRLTSQQERSFPRALHGITEVVAKTEVDPLLGGGLHARPPDKSSDAKAVASAPLAAPGGRPLGYAPLADARDRRDRRDTASEAVLRRPSTPEGVSYEPAYYLQRAQEAFQRHDFDTALHELDRVPAGPPAWLEVYRLGGAILLQQGRLAEAEAACQHLLAHDPWHADAHFLLGLIFRQQGQISAALQSLKQAIYLQPSHRHAHFYLAETYRTLGLRDEARSEYENTLNALRMARSPEQSPGLNLTGLEDDLLRQACEVNLKKLQGSQEQAGATLRGRPPSRRNGA
jgi:chemotaxis protein methyltransferase CheR